MKTILFQGDSITDAGRQGEDSRCMGFGYATLVQGTVSYEYPKQYIFHNRGVSGNRVSDLYARMQTDILDLKPDIMSVLVGVNDWGGDDEEYFVTYSKLIEEVRISLPQIKIMILEPFVLKSDVYEKCWEQMQDAVHRKGIIAKEIAISNRLPFVSLQDKFDEAVKLAPNDYWLFDGVHPSAAGHELIKREWLKAFNHL